MPSERFNRLPDEKKQRIIEKCFEEFSNNNYKDASLSKLVKELQIAKGSIYKYFKNKEDVYFYLIEKASSTKLNHIEKQIRKNYTPESDLLWATIFEGNIFDVENKLIAKFLIRVLDDNNDYFEFDMREKILLRSYDLIFNYVETQQRNNKLRTDIDVLTITHFINTIVSNVGILLARKSKQELNEYLDNSYIIRDLETNQISTNMTDGLRQIYNLLLNGIKT